MRISWEKCTARCTGRLLVGLLFVTGWTGAAEGHSITTLRGRADLRSDHLTIAYELTAHDLLHFRPMQPDENSAYEAGALRDTAQNFGDYLARMILVRGDDGVTVDARLDSCSFHPKPSARFQETDLLQTPVRFIVACPLAKKNKYLSFQVNLPLDSGRFFTSVVLFIHQPQQQPQSILLTRGGNVEVVLTASCESRQQGKRQSTDTTTANGCDPTAFVLDDALHTLRTLLTVRKNRAHLEMFIPVRILETWLPLDHADPDFLEPEEQTRQEQTIAQFLKSRNPLGLNGNVAEPQSVFIGLLDVGETEASMIGSRCWSTLTSRFRIDIEYMNQDPIKNLDLQWTMFNAKILTVQAMLVTDGACSETEMSTYDPHLRWSKSAVQIAKP